MLVFHGLKKHGHVMILWSIPQNEQKQKYISFDLGFKKFHPWIT